MPGRVVQEKELQKRSIRPPKNMASGNLAGCGIPKVEIANLTTDENPSNAELFIIPYISRDKPLSLIFYSPIAGIIWKKQRLFIGLCQLISHLLPHGLF